MNGKTWTGSCVADAVALRRPRMLPVVWNDRLISVACEDEDVLPLPAARPNYEEIGRDTINRFPKTLANLAADPSPQQPPAQRGMYYWLRKKLVG